MTSDSTLPGDLAGEYVLGTLDANERAAFEARLASDRALMAQVAFWEARLSPLNASTAAVQPQPQSWIAVERAINPQSGRLAANDNSVALMRSVSRWRIATVMTGAMAAALALFVIHREALPVKSGLAPPAYVAVVNRGGDLPALIVRVDLATNDVSVRPVSPETPAGKSLELWYIGDGKSPQSMGIVDHAAHTIKLPVWRTDRKSVVCRDSRAGRRFPNGRPDGSNCLQGTACARIMRAAIRY